MLAFLFPGQGSQEVGMGADLFRTDPEFRSHVAQASEQVGADLEHICLRGPETKLRQSRYLQPLMVCVSLGYWRKLAAHGIRPGIVLGHSLGEVSALGASGVVTSSEAVRMAAQRGMLMDEAAAAHPGGMAVVTTHDRSALLARLKTLAAAFPPLVMLANDNAPIQVVISGDHEGLRSAMECITREHLGKCRLIPVAGPWHSSYLVPAREGFRTWADGLTFKPPEMPVLCCGSAAETRDPGEILTQVTQVLAGPVRWADCMTRLLALKPTALLEVGAGRVLSGLARANGFDDATPVFPVNNLRGVEAAVAALARA